MSEIDHSQRAHSVLGASSASRWMTCPASIPLAEGIEDTTSVYAEEGTVAHEVCEMILRNEEVPESLNGFNIDEVMIEHCMMYVDYINERSEGAEVYIEERVDLSHIDPSMFGTNDGAIYKPFKTLEVIDFKYGQGLAVDAEHNSQLMYYALGMVKDMDVETVKMTIVQPRANHPKGPIRSWEISVGELMAWETDLKNAVAEVKRAEAIAEAGDEKVLYSDYAEAGSHCKFCKAAGFCKKLKDEAMAVAKTDFDDVEIELPKPDSLTPDEIGKVLASSSMLEGWIKAVRTHAHKQAENGFAVSGFKLVKKKANRKWKDESLVVEEFEDIMGDKLFEKKLLTPAKLEKIIGKESVSEHTFKPETGTTLAPITDKRAEIRPQIEEDFTDI